MMTLAWTLVGAFSVVAVWPVILVAGFLSGLLMFPYIVIRECVKLTLPRKWRKEDE